MMEKSCERYENVPEKNQTTQIHALAICNLFRTEGKNGEFFSKKTLFSDRFANAAPRGLAKLKEWLSKV